MPAYIQFFAYFIILVVALSVPVYLVCRLDKKIENELHERRKKSEPPVRDYAADIPGTVTVEREYESINVGGVPGVRETVTATTSDPDYLNLPEWVQDYMGIRPRVRTHTREMSQDKAEFLARKRLVDEARATPQQEAVEQEAVEQEAVEQEAVEQEAVEQEAGFATVEEANAALIRNMDNFHQFLSNAQGAINKEYGREKRKDPNSYATKRLEEMNDKLKASLQRADEVRAKAPEHLREER